jgi:hypothetical protein
MAAKIFGSPSNPLNLKCTSFGSPDPAKPYLCLVFEDGTQVYAGMTFNIVRLFNAQSAEIVAGWPVEPVKAL